MNKEVVTILLIILTLLSFSPYIGLIFVILDLLMFVALPIVVLVVFSTPSLRYRFLSA